MIDVAFLPIGLWPTLFQIEINLLVCYNIELFFSLVSTVILILFLFSFGKPFNKNNIYYLNSHFVGELYIIYCLNLSSQRAIFHFLFFSYFFFFSVFFFSFFISFPFSSFLVFLLFLLFLFLPFPFLLFPFLLFHFLLSHSPLFHSLLFLFLLPFPQFLH